jgi:mannosyl-oligosaccharide glucosidase
MAKLEQKYARSEGEGATAFIQSIHRDISEVAARSGVESAELEWGYDALARHLASQLDKVHWNNLDGVYQDIGHHDNEHTILTEVLVRCRNPLDKTTVDVGALAGDVNQRRVNCPETHPEFLFPLRAASGDGLEKTEKVVSHKQTLSLQFVRHVGYISIFPLLLGLLPADSPRLGQLMDVLRDPDHLWTDHGIRSLSKLDLYYSRNNAPGDAPYWRAPIWININYLVLRSLKYYSSIQGPFQTKASSLYQELKENILKTTRNEYLRSGDLW